MKLLAAVILKPNKLIVLFNKNEKLTIKKKRKFSVNYWEFPFVCLNSVVEIEDVEQTEIFNYRLIEPETINNETDCITMLSPIGKAFLYYPYHSNTAY